MKVLIADDEQIVLNGLKYIINWKCLGFSICDTAMNGQETLNKILTYQPDLVLLDIKMPIMTGIEVIQNAISLGFRGKFILLSGISDFKLAQKAMTYGVNFYLTKPIDEEELERCVYCVATLIAKESKKNFSYKRYLQKAKLEILKDIMLDQCDYFSLDLNDLHLNTNVYQVIAYENYNQDFFHCVWNFKDLIRVTNQDNNSFDDIEINHHNIILLKGDHAITRFNDMLEHYKTTPQKGAPLDAVFFAYGQKVAHIPDIHQSFKDVCNLMNRRFFCRENQHVIGFEELVLGNDLSYTITPDMAKMYAEQFLNYIQSNNQSLIKALLKKLNYDLAHTNSEISTIKHLLIDIYILVKQKIAYTYRNVDVAFMANATLIDLIEQKYYLYEIISFLAEQFELWTHNIGYCTAETILDEVLYYIQHNYQDNLKLESIASLFGYNSSYIGKIFHKKLGINFNSYVDQIRINESKKILVQNELKVYKIAEKVGYNNVDYFHKKFKMLVGITPLEYRKTHQAP